MRPPLHLPPRLPERPVIRVVHPCGTLAPHRDALEAGLTRLEAAGCRIRWTPSRADACWRGYLAGEDDARSEELIAALGEPGVDAVWFARGGSGGARIADRVVRAAADLPPRIVIGFSDATVFLDLLAARLGWVTFHGPVVTSLAHPAIDVDLEATLALLRGQRHTIALAENGEGEPEHLEPHGDRSADDEPDDAIVGPEGRLMGGNLTVLAASVGTSAAPVGVEDAIWLLEDVGEPPYRLDRSFWQLRSSGVLAGARALWIGDLGLPPADAPFIAERFGEDSGLPVLHGAPAGHRGRLDVLPIGGSVRLDLRRRRLVGTAPWVGERG